MGARLAVSDYILFLNSDIVLRDNWLEPMLALIKSNPKIGLVGPKLVFAKDKPEDIELVQSCGGGFDVAKAPYHFNMGWRADDERVSKTRAVPWITGAAMLIPRTLFFGMGGFDESYVRGYFEDVDFCMKLHDAGYEVWYCAETVMTHKVGSSMAAALQTPDQTFKASVSFNANNARFHSKWDDKITPDVQIRMVPF